MRAVRRPADTVDLSQLFQFGRRGRESVFLGWPKA
jgi:hypothetical protein